MQYAPLRDYFTRVMDCTVKSVYDGDTLRADCGGDSVKVRFYCIDAPEMAQKPWGRESRNHLRSLLPRGKEITIIRRDTDKYGRIVGEILMNQQNLNRLQIPQGHVAVYRKYYTAHLNLGFYDDERQAKENARGIWASAGDQQEPWKYRQR